MPSYFESGFVRKQQAWHGLATLVQEAPSVSEAIKLAGLDWDVTLEPLYCDVMTGYGMDRIEIEDKRAVLRSSDRSVLGVVSDSYKVFQNTEAFDWFQPLVEDGTVQLETAGSLQEGRKVWIQASYAEPIEITDGDVVNPYLLLAAGHDGKMSICLTNTPIRVVCWNTLSAAQGTAGQQANLRIRHMGDVSRNVNAARKTIVEMNQDLEHTTRAWRTMSATPVTEDQVRDMARRVFDHDYQKAQALITKFRRQQEHAPVELAEKARKAIAELEASLDAPHRATEQVIQNLHEGPGADMAGMTVWGAYNAITHQIDHTRQGSAAQRLTSTWFGNGARQRDEAHKLALAAI